MCTKKEYTCYEGKEVADCCNSRVKEAVKRRTTIILLIVSVAFLIIALVTKTADNKIFVDQFSFASTITSIILSVIAIWMSITGERSTSEIKSKVSDAADRLAKTTVESEKLTENLKETLEKQKEIYSSMKRKMDSIADDIHWVKDSVESLSSVAWSANGAENKNIPSDVLLFFNNTFEHLGGNEFKKDFLYLVSYVFKNEKRTDVQIKELSDLMIKRGTRKEYMFSYITLLISFTANGLFKEDYNYEKIKEKYEKYFD